MRTKEIAYNTLRDSIRLKITKEWVPGTKIPSERKLERIYGTSRVTIGKALSQLVSEGLLERRQGSGTYVKAPAQKSLLFRYIYYLSDLGLEPYPGHIILMQYLQKKLRDLGHDLLISFQTPEMADAAHKPVEQGALLIGSVASEYILSWQQKGMPIVLVDHEDPDIIIDSVCPNNRSFGKIAATELIKTGHKRIAYIGGENRVCPGQEWSSSIERRRGIAEALAEHEIAWPKEYQELDWRGERAIPRLLSLPVPPSAIILFADAMVPHVMRLLSAVTHVPQLFTFGGIPSCADEFNIPSLLIDWSEMADEAVRILLQRVKNPHSPAEKVRPLLRLNRSLCSTSDK